MNIHYPNIPRLLTEIHDTGLSEQQIVDRLFTEYSVRTTQGTLNRIRRGVLASIRYPLGCAIVALHKTLVHPEHERLRAKR